MLPGLSFCREPNTQDQPSRPPVMRLDYDRVPAQEKAPNRSSGALDVPPHKEPSGSVIPEGKVTKVLSIHYNDCCLKKAKLLVVVQFEGKEKTGWFEYDDIEEHDGVREALKEFGPWWNAKETSDTARDPRQNK
jgi:hypothetical protein